MDIPFQRVLAKDVQRKKYRRRRGEIKSVIHWGQRKLLMSEIEFITCHLKIADESDHFIVVYAGAAPGTHISFLSSLFPSIKFVLVDPAPFTVHDSDHIEIRQELFTDEMAQDPTIWGVGWSLRGVIALLS